MSNAARTDANRRNARQSTGPKSREGKTRSAQNARRHGLSLPVTNDPSLSARTEALARLLAGEAAGVRRLERARRVAEAEIDILRVRNARYLLLRNAIENVDYEPPQARKSRVKLMNRLLLKVLEVEAKEAAGDVPPPNTIGSFLAEKLTETGADGQSPMDVFVSRWLLPQQLPEMDRIAAIMRELASRLTSLDRYERRAMSRRKYAIRDLDQLAPRATGFSL